MKLFNFTKHALILGALSAFAVGANATSLFIYSDASTVTNNVGPTYNVPAGDGNHWDGPLAGSSWVSSSQTGNSSAPKGDVTYSYQFSIDGALGTGSLLDVLADDTTTVLLNGKTLSTGSNNDQGWLVVNEGNLSLTGALQTGINTLTFQVTNAGGPSGLDFNGTINYAAAPEPGTVALMGLPLLALGLFRRKRKA